MVFEKTIVNVYFDWRWIVRFGKTRFVVDNKIALILGFIFLRVGAGAGGGVLINGGLEKFNADFFSKKN